MINGGDENDDEEEPDNQYLWFVHIIAYEN